MSREMTLVRPEHDDLERTHRARLAAAGVAVAFFCALVAFAPHPEHDGAPSIAASAPHAE